MGFFDFVKGIGKKNTAAPVEQATQGNTEPSAQQVANQLLGLVQSLNLGISNLSVVYDPVADLAVLKGEAATQADKEKAVLAVGNVDHVAKVDDQLTVANPTAQSQFYTVQSGDNLSKISKHFYADANQYQKIFEANQPLLKHPDEIFPGQVLRIPA